MVLDLELEGKVAAISGGSEGIGKATARRLAAEGVRVAICARREETLERAAAEIRDETGGEVCPLRADMTDPEDVERFIKETVESFGGIDILVNNAGARAALAFEDIDDNKWAHDFDLKFFSAVRSCRLAIPHMRERGGGRIVNVTHVTAKAPRAETLPTVASRAAAMALTKTLSREFARDNILVNTVCVGIVKSGQWERRREREAPDSSGDEWYAEQASLRDIPLDRFGEPEEAADLIAFLVSARAGYITGTAINFDGGSARTL